MAGLSLQVLELAPQLELARGDPRLGGAQAGPRRLEILTLACRQAPVAEFTLDGTLTHYHARIGTHYHARIG